MKIPKRKRERIAQLSAELIRDYDWIYEYKNSERVKLSMLDRIDNNLYKNEALLIKITNQFTPDELIEQIEDENFQGLNTAGDYGNSEIKR